MNDRWRDYETVAEALRFIRAQRHAQPGLDTIAAHVGLSPFVLQKTFSAWAGISPKRFLQCLTRDHARALLRDSHDLLDATLETGLSSPGRLHDLMVSCDAVTPGEVRALGAGLEIVYGYGPTPWGPVLAARTARGICHLQFTDGHDDAAFARLRDDWPEATLRRDDTALAACIARLDALAEPGPPLPLLLRGTNFQVKVWSALLSIAPGQAVSYGSLARMVGMPKAQRAVGSAVARNRIALLIPCHRVIRESGEVGEYRWGSERKLALLACESSRSDYRTHPRDNE